MTIVAYGLFLATAIAAFVRFPRIAVWPIFFLGFCWLPPVIKPDLWPDHDWQVVGGALPSLNILGKAQIVPLVCLLGALASDQRRRKIVLSLSDSTVILFCIWPMAQAAILAHIVTPPASISVAYLFSTWAGLWFLGRFCLRDLRDLRAIALSLSFFTAALLPLIVFEQTTNYRLHEIIFGPHPFAQTGQNRWIGNRPLLFFEDGNQYGIWVACAALSAVWLWKTDPRPRNGVLAILLVSASMASQSAGAVILLALGLFLLYFRLGRSMALTLGPILVLLGLLLGSLQLFGFIDARDAILDNPAGRAVYEILREVGRGSLGWRVSQDIKTLPTIRESLLTGTGTWNWFNELGTRPWGFVQLAIAQFGVIGFCALAVTAALTVRSVYSSGKFERELLIFPSLLIFMAAIDSVLNSFIFYPAIVLVGGVSNLAGKNVG